MAHLVLLPLLWRWPTTDAEPHRAAVDGPAVPPPERVRFVVAGPPMAGTSRAPRTPDAPRAPRAAPVGTPAPPPAASPLETTPVGGAGFEAAAHAIRGVTIAPRDARLDAPSATDTVRALIPPPPVNVYGPCPPATAGLLGGGVGMGCRAIVRRWQDDSATAVAIRCVVARVLRLATTTACAVQSARARNVDTSLAHRP